MNDNLNERALKAKLEIDELINWSIAEAKKVSEQLTREGAVLGLDGHQESRACLLG